MEPLTPTWSEPGNVAADLRAVLHHLRSWQPPEARVASLDVAPAILREVEARVKRDLDRDRVGSPWMRCALLVRSDPSLPVGVMLGRSVGGKLVGVYFEGKGWVWLDRIEAAFMARESIA